MPSIEVLTSLVQRAGQAILDFYGGREFEEKSDQSPITAADRAAHSELADGLSGLVPALPLLSEESRPEEIAGRGSWERFWLVDPLDGTKEFLKGSGEFTVNVALIESGSPVLGIVHAPALDRTYRASVGAGAERSVDGSPFDAIRTRPFPGRKPVIVASRDHAGPRTSAVADALGEDVEFTSMGSSLKFCLVAEGRADVYLRDGPTMEWDTAAAQCVVEGAGGRVWGLEGPRVGSTLTYNKSTLQNPHFLCVGDPDGAWSDLIR